MREGARLEGACMHWKLVPPYCTYLNVPQNQEGKEKRDREGRWYVP